MRFSSHTEKSTPYTAHFPTTNAATGVSSAHTPDDPIPDHTVDDPPPPPSPPSGGVGTTQPGGACFINTTSGCRRQPEGRCRPARVSSTTSPFGVTGVARCTCRHRLFSELALDTHTHIDRAHVGLP